MQREFFLDKIVSIVEVGEEDTIDISVTGNRLFVANDIVTHNCGIGSSDVDMTDISESIGVAATCDFIMAWIRTPDLDETNSAMLKIIKSRFGSTTSNLRHIVGVDYEKMTVFSLDDGGQVSDSGYVVKKETVDPTELPWSDKPFGGEKKKDFGSIKF